MMSHRRRGWPIDNYCLIGWSQKIFTVITIWTVHIVITSPLLITDSMIRLVQCNKSNTRRRCASWSRCVGLITCVCINAVSRLSDHLPSGRFSGGYLADCVRCRSASSAAIFAGSVCVLSATVSCFGKCWVPAVLDAAGSMLTFTSDHHIRMTS